MKKYRLIILVFALFFNLWGCTPAFLHIPDPTVYVKEEIPPQETPSKFPYYYPEIGMYTAKLFF